MKRTCGSRLRGARNPYLHVSVVSTFVAMESPDECCFRYHVLAGEVRLVVLGISHEEGLVGLAIIFEMVSGVKKGNSQVRWSWESWRCSRSSLFG